MAARAQSGMKTLQVCQYSSNLMFPNRVQTLLRVLRPLACTRLAQMKPLMTLKFCSRLP